MMHSEYKWLDRIDSPDDLKKLSGSDFVSIATNCVSTSSSNVRPIRDTWLRAWERWSLPSLCTTYSILLTIKSWDVGHQTYAHKIITGRREAFRTNRKLGGISGFPRMSRVLTTLSAADMPPCRFRRRSVWPKLRNSRASSGRWWP